MVIKKMPKKLRTEERFAIYQIRRDIASGVRDKDGKHIGKKQRK